MTAGSGLVYIVAKAPRPGQTKTRLSPPLTREQAALLAAAFLRDTLDVVQRAGAAVRLICRDEAEREALAPLAGGVRIDVQRGAGLGAALESAFGLGLADGHGVVAVLGTDIPMLPAAIVAEALAACADERDVALGPSDDGGYYLLAARRLHSSLFREMTWSTRGVAQETLRRASALGLRVHTLPVCQDVDDAPGLERLRAALAAAPLNVAPHTRAALGELGQAPRGAPAIAV